MSVGYSFGLLLILFILALEVNFLWLFGDMPSMKEARNPKLATPSQVYSADNILLGSFMTENRSPVKFDEIHQTTIDALIATEDVRFYEHNGIDFRSLGGAILATVKDESRGGASTINQQLVKNLYKTRGKRSSGLLGKIPLVRTLIAKLKEWITALKMNYIFDKNEILTLYLNAVDFGDNTYGIKLASEHFFSKLPEELEVHQSAVLIGGLKATNSYNPIRKPERALQRRNVVLGQMLKYGKIDSETYEKALKKPLDLNPTSVVKENFKAPYFMAALKPKLEKWCIENRLSLYADGLKISTTIDSRAQLYAEKAVADHLSIIQKNLNAEQGVYTYWYDKTVAMELAEFKKTNPNFKEIPLTRTQKALNELISKSERYKLLLAQNHTKEEVISIMSEKRKVKLFFHDGPKEVSISSVDSLKYMAQQLQVGLVSIEPNTGKIRAWVGGPNYNYFNYDHVNQATRQAGSIFKPLIYAAALEQGIDPCTTIVDRPISFETVINGKGQKWEPKNANHTYTYTPLSLRKALGRSVNSVAIRLLEEVKPKSIISLATRLGISTKIEDDLSIALGTNDVKLLEIASAFTTFVNGGKRMEPVLFDKIIDNNGAVLYFDLQFPDQVLKPKTAYDMTVLLRGSVEESGGTSRSLHSYGITSDNEVGGKTGTTNGYADGWYMGITQNLVTGVWVGCENPRIHFESFSGQGSKTALPIFGKYMKSIYGDKLLNITKTTFTQPENYSKLNCINIILPKPDSTSIRIDSSSVNESEVAISKDTLVL